MVASGNYYKEVDPKWWEENCKSKNDKEALSDSSKETLIILVCFLCFLLGIILGIYA